MNFQSRFAIDLQPPSLIEVVRIAEDCFVFVAGMNEADDHFVMFSPIASFDKRLRIYIQVWRPIHEPNRKEIRLFPNNPISVPKIHSSGGTRETRYLSPISEAQLALQLIRVRNPLVLDLETQRKVASGCKSGVTI